MQRSSTGSNIVATIFYAVLATVLLFVINVHTVWQFTSSHLLGNTAPSNIDYSSITAPVFNYLDKLGTPVLMVFWVILGTASYSLAIFVQTAISSVYKETKEAAYVRPPTYQKRYWQDIWENNLLLVGLIASWTVSIFIFFQLLLPRFSKLLNQSLDAGTLERRAGYLASAIILTAICLFLIVKLSQLLKQGWHRFSA